MVVVEVEIPGSAWRGKLEKDKKNRKSKKRKGRYKRKNKITKGCLPIPDLGVEILHKPDTAAVGVVVVAAGFSSVISHQCKHCGDDVEFILAADRTYISTRPQRCRRPSSVPSWRCTTVGALVVRHTLTLTLGVLGLIVLGCGNLGGKLKMKPVRTGAREIKAALTPMTEEKSKLLQR